MNQEDCVAECKALADDFDKIYRRLRKIVDTHPDTLKNTCNCHLCKATGMAADGQTLLARYLEEQR